MQRPLDRLVAVLGSFRLAAALFVLMLLLTLFGTIAQGTHTIYDVQAHYFGSVFVIHRGAGFLPLVVGVVLAGLAVWTVLLHWARRTLSPWTALVAGVLLATSVYPFVRYAQGADIPLPLPGAMLLLPLLFVNLIVGGLLRMRRGTSTLGVFIVHLGIVILLVGSWVESRFSTSGQMVLYEGDASDEYVSFRSWELATTEIRPDHTAREYVVPAEDFSWTNEGGTARFAHPDLPFDVLVSGYATNAVVKRVGASAPSAVDGWTLETRPPVTKAEEDQNLYNAPGARVTLVERTTGASHRGLVSARAAPYGVRLGDAEWTVELRPRRWTLPFQVHLDRFVHEYHPGTMIPRRFSSFVTKTEAGSPPREVHITMNEPLRSEGYTLYQSGWGPENAPPGSRLYSNFAVVSNPSDRVPLYSCVIIAIGMLIHFVMKLVKYLERQSHHRVRVELGSAT